MGAIHTEVTLRPIDDPERAYAASFLVDTGATDCLAPGNALRAIGVEPVGTTTYELADGTIQEYAFGLLRIELLGEITAGRVVFGPDDVEPLLGVTALESVGVTIDPVTQALKRLPAVPLKRAPGRWAASAVDEVRRPDRTFVGRSPLRLLASC